MSSTRTDTSSTCTPSVLYSRPLLVTSMRTAPAAERVVLHTSACALAHRARRTVLPIRHSSAPTASDAAEKCAPCTVTGVPPSAIAVTGETKLTAAAAWYVYSTLPPLYCCAFIESSSGFAPSECTGVEHSSWLSSMYRASTADDAFSKRQRSVYASLKPEPSTVTRVPPRSGPIGGVTLLAISSVW